MKYQSEIYTAPINGRHSDAIPAHLADEFHRRAMQGEDISEFRFGFITSNGDFLNREDALKYAIDADLLDPNEAGCGTLPAHVKRKDWALMPVGKSPLHSDVDRDVEARGYCFFQVVEG